MLLTKILCLLLLLAPMAYPSAYSCIGFYSPVPNTHAFRSSDDMKVLLKDVSVQIHSAKYDQARSSVIVHFLYKHTRGLSVHDLLDLAEESPDLDTRETLLIKYFEENISRITVNEIVQMAITAPYYETREHLISKYLQKYLYQLKPMELAELNRLNRTLDYSSGLGF